MTATTIPWGEDADALHWPKHERLWTKRQTVCLKAGISEAHLRMTMGHFGCTERDKDYCRDVTQKLNNGAEMSDAGYLIASTEGAEDRLFGMAGALTRQYINVSVVSLYQVIEAIFAGEELTSAVLLIPNFYLPFKDKSLTGRELAKLHDFLIRRMISGDQTVVYVDISQKWDKVESDLGKPIVTFLRSHYRGGV